MGKLTIEGKASREFQYDLMEISLKFWAKEGSTTAALKKITQQSVEFLAIMDSTGIKIEEFRIRKDSVENEKYSDKFSVKGERELSICIPFNMDFLNYIRDIIQKKAFDAEIDTTYKFSDIEKIHKELIRIALLDAKEKAECIAQTMGQKVMGVQSVVIGESRLKSLISRSNKTATEESMDYYDSLLNILSRRVQAPVTTESETVQVEWLIE